MIIQNHNIKTMIENNAFQNIARHKSPIMSEEQCVKPMRHDTLCII